MGPGPNAYRINLNSAYQKSPNFSLWVKKRSNPKINAYLVIFPSIFSGERHRELNMSCGPGPAMYEAKKMLVNRKAIPAYSMGLRTPLLKGISSPGPGHYNIAGMKPGDRGPMYTFGMQHSLRAPPMVICGDNCC
jgi:hypothetical protein